MGYYLILVHNFHITCNEIKINLMYSPYPDGVCFMEGWVRRLLSFHLYFISTLAFLHLAALFFFFLVGDSYLSQWMGQFNDNILQISLNPWHGFKLYKTNACICKKKSQLQVIFRGWGCNYKRVKKPKFLNTNTRK